MLSIKKRLRLFRVLTKKVDTNLFTKRKVSVPLLAAFAT